MKVYRAKVSSKMFAYVEVKAEDETDFFSKVDDMLSEDSLDFEYDETPEVEVLDCENVPF